MKKCNSILLAALCCASLCQADNTLQQARNHYQNGQVLQAQQQYATLLQQDGRNPDVLLGLATIAQQQGNTLEAQGYFSRILILDPRNSSANAALANNESKLKVLLREQNNSAVLHFALANLYATQTRWHEAQQSYFNAYTLEPNNATYAHNLAVSLDRLKQHSLAAQYYQRALQLDMAQLSGFNHGQVAQRVKQLTKLAPVL